MLENNIQAALAQQSIELEDAIDIREVKNLKLANQLLKVRRKRKQEQDQQQQMMLQQSQAEANIKQQEAAAQIEMQKKQTDFQVQAELEQLKSQLDSQKLMQESQVKQQLLQLEYQLKMQLEKAGGNKGANDVQREIFKENRKDQRTKIQATQQSKMIEQRDQNLPAQDFEKQEI
jgi:hypothetical protein